MQGGWLLNWQQKDTWARALDVVVALFWALFAGLYVASVVHTRNFTNAGLMVFYTLVAILFLRRRPARRSAPMWQTVVAVADVFLPIVLLRPAGAGLWMGNVIQALALGVMVVAALSLGPSFGIAPADRGLRTQGMYAFVRHPLYAGETLFYVGYLVSHMSWQNLVGLVIAVSMFVVRIRWEERIIEGYEAYASKVRWRLVPYIW